MDIWASLWQTTPKVHKSVVLAVTRRMTLFTRFETILAMVELSGVSELEDVLVTSRAIRDIRNGWRKSYDPTRKALTA